MSGTLLVFGAGFTRAFYPTAPLMVDDYGLLELLERCSSLPAAAAVLKAELRPDGLVNFERLMTRLSTGMPYDGSPSTQAEYAWLLDQLKRKFSSRIATVRESVPAAESGLDALARVCVESDITCVTFNYDDVFDERLFKVRSFTEVPTEESRYWHPDGGYGFFCRPSLTVISTMDRITMDKASPLYLKLHGSVNWMPKLGSLTPHSIDSIVHHESWLPVSEYDADLVPSRKVIWNHLEHDAFIIPPVLTKSDLISQPILRYVWSLAFDYIRDANEVVFVGYSFPASDLSSQFLFSEAIPHDFRARVTVVNFADDEHKRQELRQRYREVLPELEDGQFDWRGAVPWAAEFVAQVDAAAAAPAP